MAEHRDLSEFTSAYELLVRCAWCERIKMDDEWVEGAEVQTMRQTRRSPERHSHGICPDCFAKLTPRNRP